MTITVILHRQQKEEPDYGMLRAYVEQDGRRGRNLLSGRHITGEDYAMRVAAQELSRKWPAATIQWKLEGASQPGQQPATPAAARDGGAS